jgi:peptidyl-prolyl cis-trans isomerase-like 4
LNPQKEAMAVLLETSLGDVVIDVYVEEAPVAAKNFLKLIKTKYYNQCEFFNVQRDYLIQTGDPTNTGRGGESLYGQLYGAQAHYFQDEIRSDLKHTRRGLIAMANAGRNRNTSQFYITTGDRLPERDGLHTIFGEVWVLCPPLLSSSCTPTHTQINNHPHTRSHALLLSYPDLLPRYQKAWTW